MKEDGRGGVKRRNEGSSGKGEREREKDGEVVLIPGCDVASGSCVGERHTLQCVCFSLSPRLISQTHDRFMLQCLIHLFIDMFIHPSIQIYIFLFFNHVSPFLNFSLYVSMPFYFSLYLRKRTVEEWQCVYLSWFTVHIAYVLHKISRLQVSILSFSLSHWQLSLMFRKCFFKESQWKYIMKYPTGLCRQLAF